MSVSALIGGVDHPMTADGDLFAVAVPITGLVDYRYRIVYPGATGGTDEFVVADGYRFLPSIGEVDVHLFAEGRHETLGRHWVRGSSRTPPPTARSPAPRSRCGHPTQKGGGRR